MDLMKFFRRKSFGPGWVGSLWGEPSERNLKGYLEAYSEVYSLFAISLRIAEAVSEVKWRLYKGSERSERSQLAEHPILRLLDHANDFQTGQEVVALTQLHLDLAGRAYWYLPRNQLRVPGEIWVLAPHLVKIVPSKEKGIAGYTYKSGRELIPLPADEVIRFAMPDPIDFYGGVGYVKPSEVELDSELFAGRWNRNFFFNSARADAVLEVEGKIDEPTFQRLHMQWREQHGGVSRAHRVAILEDGLKYKQTQISPKDMDFAQLRRMSRENAMFAFGMPLSVMGITENVNRANAEAGEYTFARWLVKPRLTRIKNKLNEQLVPMFPQAKGVELDFDEVVPETAELKRLAAESGMRSGFMTINEARKLNGLDPIPSGDMLLQPLNTIMTPAGKVAKSFEKNDEQKEAYWQAYVLKSERQEQFFERTLKVVFDEQEEAVIANLKRERTLAGAMFDREEENKRFASAFAPLIQNVYESAMREVIEGRKQEFLDPFALEWIATRSLLLAKLLNGTTVEQLRKVLAEGFELGESIPKLSKRVREYYGDTYKARATMVARTEVITASAQGAEQGYREMGVRQVQWYTALDERTCPECMPMHNEVYPVGEGPRPALHPNCRCVMLPV